MQTIDLHSHSQHSDGRLQVPDLIRAAQQAGVTTLALTDHDTTAGLTQAAASAAEAGMTLIPGVEISASWRHQTVHILGLGIDVDTPMLQQGLQALRDKRGLLAQKIHDKLCEAGIDGALPWVQHRVQGGLISRTHFAEFLLEAGVAKDMRAVFKHYLVHGKPGYVSTQWCDLGEALAWIKAAGGMAVIAHPARYKLTRTKLIRLIEEFIAAGGEGLEVVSSSHSEADIKQLADLANKFQLFASCGSDFHSPDLPWAQLGRIPSLPEHCTPIWQAPAWAGWSDICNKEKNQVINRQ